MTASELSLLIEGRALAATGRGREIRERAGLSRAELARAAGVSAAAVSRWEDGKRTPTGESAIAYARALRRIAREVALHV
jgi:transcriptional regulator with XRE-family HTH domain